MAMRTVAEHRSEVLGAVTPRGAETLPLSAAAGRTLATAVRAAVDLPAWDNSAMDGFAVRYSDVAGASPAAPVTLRVVADVPAGSGADPALSPGEAARIMTGAPLPADADTVVPFEHTSGGLTDSLRTATVLTAPRTAGANVRVRAQDAAVGDEVLPPGTLLGAWQLAAAAASGVPRVSVHRAPRVVVLSTGDELVPPGEPLRRGQIPESNATLLATLMADAGATVLTSGSVDDDEARFLAALERAEGAGADVVVTSGGVSAGAFEVVKNALAREAGIRFGPVAMQPGKPQGFGVLPGGALFFGLPGNPVSVAVSFEAFVRPALMRMQGRAEERPLIRLPSASAWRSPLGKVQYVPVRIDRSDPARWRVHSLGAGGGGSHLAATLGRAEAYAVVDAEVPAVSPGDTVDVLLVS
jgi:molybdopterin molybdotransferase